MCDTKQSMFKASPALYRLTRSYAICGGPLSWAWMKLSELTEMVNALFPENERDESGIWEAYLDLSDQHSTLTWSDGFYFTLDQPPVDFEADVYVPAGWGTRVIVAAGKGIYSTSLVYSPDCINRDYTQYPLGTIHCVDRYAAIAYDAEGEVMSHFRTSKLSSL